MRNCEGADWFGCRHVAVDMARLCWVCRRLRVLRVEKTATRIEMAYLIKQASTGKWVAEPGSEHSYTNDRSCAATFQTVDDARKEMCEEGESIWYEVTPLRRVV